MDYPLALCDSQTVDDDDLVAYDYVLPNFDSESYLAKFNPNHRWYYKSDQTENDLLIIMNCDSKSGISESYNTLETWRPMHSSILLTKI